MRISATRAAPTRSSASAAAARAPSPASADLARSPRQVAQRQAIASSFGAAAAPAAPVAAAAPIAPAAAEAAPRLGTLANLARFVGRPGDERNPELAAAMALWGRYSNHVRVAAVSFRVLPETSRESHLGSEHRIGGRSHWEERVPVIELPQAILDDVAAYLALRGTDAAAAGDTETPGDAASAAAVRFQRAPLERAHEAVRLIGHELYHLWRAKEQHAGNPLQQPYERESVRRMAEVRANWVSWLHGAPSATLRSEGIAAGTAINRWQDIPAAAQQRIEQGAAGTDYIDGLYQRSAYLVEEIYTKVEELSYLRAQQRDDRAAIRNPSLNEVSQLSSLVYFLHNVLRSQVDPNGLVTPALLQQTETAMLAHLRSRYPSQAGRQYDSYEVIFYLCAIAGGIPPVYSEGRLLSTVRDARLPPAP